MAAIKNSDGSTTHFGGGYSVTVSSEGAIQVRPGDSLSKYSMAIHGDFNHLHEFRHRRDKPVGPIDAGDLKTIPNANLINVGELIYHVASSNSNKISETPVVPQTMRHAAQGPVSFDCGFFAGFAARLVQQYGIAASSVHYQIDDVYEARSLYYSWMGIQNVAGPLDDSSKSVNSAQEMKNYLKVLGCDAEGSTQYYSCETNKTVLHRALANAIPPMGSRKSTLLTIRSLRFAHWVCILPSGVNGNGAQFYIYDPGRKSGNTLGTGTLETCVDWLAQVGLSYIVAV